MREQPCYVPYCSNEPEHQVAQVWFDFGEQGMGFCSTAGGNGTELPWVCEGHKRSAAHAVASAWLLTCYEQGFTGPLWPTRWWVRYADGHVIGGDVGPRPAPAARPLIVDYRLALKTDPNQALTHLVLAEDGGAAERTACGTVPEELEDAELPIIVGLLCPGCFLFFTRTLAAHFHLPLK